MNTALQWIDSVLLIVLLWQIVGMFRDDWKQKQKEKSQKLIHEIFKDQDSK